MSALVDFEIRRMCKNPLFYGETGLPLLEPFSEGTEGNDIISYGVTSAGYDLQLDNHVLIYNPFSGERINPKKFKDEDYRRKVFWECIYNQPENRIEGGIHYRHGNEVLIPRDGYMLGTSVEYIRMPKNLDALCFGKSTYARSGITVNMTPLEPGWEGNLTIEISNDTCSDIIIFVGEGIAQVKFYQLDEIPEIDYAAKKGKYQGQKGVTPARVK